MPPRGGDLGLGAGARRRRPVIAAAAASCDRLSHALVRGHRAPRAHALSPPPSRDCCLLLPVSSLMKIVDSVKTTQWELRIQTYSKGRFLANSTIQYPMNQTFANPSSIFKHLVTKFGLFCSSCSSYLPRIAAEGPALAGSVVEQDRERRGASGTDEASCAQPQLQPNFVHRPR